MNKPKFKVGEQVVLSDHTDIEEYLRGTRCSVKDYNSDSDEYQIVVLEGINTGNTAWVPENYLIYLSEYRLLKTINKDKYEEYLRQIDYADQIRDNIFKIIFDIPATLQVADFSCGMKVTVKRDAVAKHPWSMWESEMDWTQGQTGIVVDIEKRYNKFRFKYQNMIKVSIEGKMIFDDYVYTYWFLPEHLQIYG